MAVEWFSHHFKQQGNANQSNLDTLSARCLHPTAYRSTDEQNVLKACQRSDFG